MTRSSNLEIARRKRDLRREIARSRIRVEREARDLRQRTRQSLSWRSVVRAFPWPSLLLAFGLGYTLSRGLGRFSARAVARGSLALLLAGVRRQVVQAVLDLLSAPAASSQATAETEAPR